MTLSVAGLANLPALLNAKRNGLDQRSLDRTIRQERRTAPKRSTVTVPQRYVPTVRCTACQARVATDSTIRAAVLFALVNGPQGSIDTRICAHHAPGGDWRGVGTILSVTPQATVKAPSKPQEAPKVAEVPQATVKLTKAQESALEAYAYAHDQQHPTGDSLNDSVLTHAQDGVAICRAILAYRERTGGEWHPGSLPTRKDGQANRAKVAILARAVAKVQGS